MSLALVPLTATAQDSVEDVFGNLGSATVEEEAAPAMKRGDGAVAGRVFDADSGLPVRGVTVILMWPPTADGSPPRQEVELTNSDGGYAFGSVPPGRYDLSFIKSSFRTSTMSGLEVTKGAESRADFPLPPVVAAASGMVLDLDAFVVDAAVASDMMQDLELRMDADQFLNIMSADDFAKFAASDVADALKRVAGVNIVEGQFAIIRGLEDRYSSTLYNGAPVPSPDPDSQSVQLDLFPREVLTNLVVAKTFVPRDPSNSAGGSIDVITHAYPDEFTFGVKGAVDINSNAIDEFLTFDAGNPVGNRSGGGTPLGSEAGFNIGGREELWKREIRYKGVFNWETSYSTARGTQDSREAKIGVENLLGNTTKTGGLALGRLDLSGSQFDLTQSTFNEQWTGYGGFGFDLDEGGKHKIDLSVFYTQKSQQTVQARENGFIPDFDYGPITEDTIIEPDNVNRGMFQDVFPPAQAIPTEEVRASRSNWFINSFREDATELVGRVGGLWWTNYGSSQSFDRTRDLIVGQINGDHVFSGLDDFHVRWATNYARTTQSDESRRLRYFWEPDDPLALVSPDANGNVPLASALFPLRPEDLGPGRFANQFDDVLFSQNDVEEVQGFGRLDADYTFDLTRDIEATVVGGGWFESSTRSVVSNFLQNPISSQGNEAANFGETEFILGRVAFDDLLVDPETSILVGTATQTSSATRQIGAGHLQLEMKLFEEFDVSAGVRLEHILITGENDPFTGEIDSATGELRTIFGAPGTFPSVYTFLDRLDNPNLRVPTDPASQEVRITPPSDFVFNDQLLGLDLPINPSTGFVDLITQEDIRNAVNTRIDEFRALPSVGGSWRFYDGAILRGAYSMTTARPSLRELGYYVSVEPNSDDQVLGNPLLGLSDVQSFDGRVEYTFGDFGDLIAVSGFYKTIENPIEAARVRNPLNASGNDSAYFRVFFNNTNTAHLWGLEVEARKNLGFVGWKPAEDFTIGGNFTYINAEVDRTDLEKARAAAAFGTTDADASKQLFDGLNDTRRLFGQPEWIANADVSYDNERSGTRLTLAFFAISDVLDAAGTAGLDQAGRTLLFVPDRYVDRFYQLDLVAQQELRIGWLPGRLSARLSAKNLTNSERGLIFDTSQTNQRISERRFRIGRSFKFTLQYQF